MGEWLLLGMGVALVVEGAPYFIAPDLVRRAAAALVGQPTWVIRLLGLTSMAAGLLTVWLARS